ncbi:Crp/Fnr family transcriptional regulator [Marinomonas sp. RSW2]|uniref:Crp/Fnr family transcriptional regulator n=1 Tax=Marinomonas maritima TaxID=2940935 RepID=A0ABT5WF70_9GAMM|nr:Crp/Fnr family transcriptional regulator [Marinomonas maritima]MDE8603476.1 Crp/Fnr family transcriptional regulator [Marinomonas maritima]
MKKFTDNYFSETLGVTQTESKYLSNMFKFESIDKNIRLVEEGTKWDRVYFISTGLLRFYYTTTGGKEFNKGFFKEKDFIWPITPSARIEPSLFSIESLSQSDLWSVSFRDFQHTLKSYGVWEKFALPYAENLADQKFKREYDFLVKNAQSRYDGLILKLGKLVDRIPDYHLASYLGITNVALSRIKKRKLISNII